MPHRHGHVVYESSQFRAGSRAPAVGKLDDITRLKLHREADQDVLDLIRELMSLPVTLILVGVGIPSSGLLRDGRRDPHTGQWLFPPVKDRSKSPNTDASGQTDLRFDLLELGPFTCDTKPAIAAWTAHLVGIEQQLRLLKAEDGMLSEGDIAGAEYSSGLVKPLIGGQPVGGWPPVDRLHPA